MTNVYSRAKAACYSSYITSAAAFCLPAIMFSTFHELYGISYTLLGTLVLITFLTQLAMDLTFSFFAHRFNIKATVSLMPLVTSAGLVLYGGLPLLFPEHAFWGLAVGTVVFSAGTGLAEVLLSPLIAAMPSKSPDREMSRMHSLYACGVVLAIVVSTLYLHIVGRERWSFLAFFFALLPFITATLFRTSTLPPLKTQPAVKESIDGAGFALCVMTIFFGAGAELVMTNWASGFIEAATGIPKFLGDVLGMAAFALLLGAGRVLYAKFGRNIYRTLLFGMCGAVLCYLAAAFFDSAVINVAACGLTGLCTSMLWPGSLSYMEEKLPALGITAYAMMAAGGDLGASLAPQIMGAVTDAVSAATGSDGLGMRAGMLVSALFPMLGVAVLFIAKRHFVKKS